jgi:four helix bundle protein
MKSQGEIRKFEDLIAWQRARELTQKVYQITEDGAFAKDFGLRDQIFRSSVSIMSNLAEGFERGKRTEFHQCLSVAKSSCAELQSHLYVALDARYFDQSVFRSLMNLAEEVANIIGGLRSAVQKQRDRTKAQELGSQS